MAYRTMDEVDALCRAAGFAITHDGVHMALRKGDPGVVISMEPMMTVALFMKGCPDPGLVFRVLMPGAITRYAMALHLGLTRSEAEAHGFTADAAERELSEHMSRANKLFMIGNPGIKAEADDRAVILPSDPRWIEFQRAAVPYGQEDSA